MNRSKLRWYEWGNEKPGYVSTWVLGKDGSVIHKGHVRRDRLPKTATFDCPYS